MVRMDWNHLFAERVPANVAGDGHPYLADVADDLGLDHDGQSTLTGQLGQLPAIGWVEELGSHRSRCTFVLPLPQGFPITTAPGPEGLIGAITVAQGDWRLSHEPHTRPLLHDPTLQATLAELSPEHVEIGPTGVRSSFTDANLRRAATKAAKLAHTLSAALHGAWRRAVVDVCTMYDLHAVDGEFNGRNMSLRHVDDRWFLWVKLATRLPPGCVLRRVQSNGHSWGDPALDATLEMAPPWPPAIELLRSTPALRDATIALLHPHRAARIEADSLTVPMGSLPTGEHLAELLEDASTVHQLWQP